MIIYILKSIKNSIKLHFARYQYEKLYSRLHNQMDKATDADRQRWTMLQGIILTKGQQKWSWSKFFWKPRLVSHCCLAKMNKGVYCSRCGNKTIAEMK